MLGLKSGFWHSRNFVFQPACETVANSRYMQISNLYVIVRSRVEGTGNRPWLNVNNTQCYLAQCALCSDFDILSKKILFISPGECDFILKKYK